ncbi:hypothetical protein Taro_044013 [Colocasia esculenta]|uniref:Uncharacterized protein n=1 Tax=Colocasia esculenta TaxID=4460 RepID=A0A843WHX8_COLES|nr:hypothetical protein [Colocasia esculenta]
MASAPYGAVCTHPMQLQFIGDSRQSIGDPAQDADQAVGVLLPLLSVQLTVRVLGFQMSHQRSAVPFEDLHQLGLHVVFFAVLPRRGPPPLVSFPGRRRLLGVLLRLLLLTCHACTIKCSLIRKMAGFSLSYTPLLLTAPTQIFTLPGPTSAVTAHQLYSSELLSSSHKQFEDLRQTVLPRLGQDMFKGCQEVNQHISCLAVDVKMGMEFRSLSPVSWLNHYKTHG